jgi:spore germination cell wall hydrolase CwlJ-like protein
LLEEANDHDLGEIRKLYVKHANVIGTIIEFQNSFMSPALTRRALKKVKPTSFSALVNKYWGA